MGNWGTALWVKRFFPEFDAGDFKKVDTVLEILGRRAKKDGQKEWVFEGPEATGHLVEPKTGWRCILVRAGIQELRLHDLRRTLGSWQAAIEANTYMIEKPSRKLPKQS